MTGIDPLLITSGVWAWESYGKDAFSWLFKRLGRSAEDAKKAAWEKIAWAQASKDYREEMQKLYGSMQIFGMNRPVPLTNVFTDVYLLDTPSAWRRHNIEELKQRAALYDAASTSDKRLAGGDLIAQTQRLFILGQPGAGKTTFLKHLVMEAVQGWINVIPIFVSLKAWSDSGLDLMPFLARQFAICAFPDAQPFIETILNGGKALVLFDGLDEVGEAQEKRQHITQAIRSFTQQYGKSKVVITCRTAATEFTFEHFRYCELADFTHEQIEVFVGRWFQENETKRTAFLAAFAEPENQRLHELASRPLLLTMLCLTFDETMAFPQRKSELYEEAIDALLKKWDSSRSIQRDQIYKKLSLGRKRQLFTELAAESFYRSEFFIPRRDLASRMVQFLRKLPPMDTSEDIDGNALLRAIEAQHGLLIERAQAIYSFSHLTFQEYFTACYIATHPSEKVFQSTVTHGANVQWREVLHLTASMLDDENTAVFFQIWVQQLQASIASDPQLTDLLTWVKQHAESNALPSSSMRAAVLTIGCIEQAVRYNQSTYLVFKRGRALVDVLADALADARADAESGALADARALADAESGALADARALALADARALDRDRALALALDNVRARDRASAVASALASVLTLAHDRLSTSTLTLALNHDLAIDLICSSALACASASTQVSKLCSRNGELPPNVSLHQIPKQDWQLSKEQWNKLEAYLNSTARLLECLERAAIGDRQAILNQLLIPLP